VTELPEGWASSTVGELAATSLGKMLDAKRQTGMHPTPYLRNINVRWGSFDLEDLGFMDIEPHELDRVLALPGDVIACEGGEPGRAAVWRGEPIALQKALHRIRPVAGVSPRYLAYALQEQASTRELDRLFTGTTIKHLPQEKLRIVPVPLAPSTEQERIVAAIEEAFSKLDAGEVGLRNVRQMLKRMSDAILAAAVAGRLVPQDPTDSPAVKLLADLGATPEDVLPCLPDGWAGCRLAEVTELQEYGLSLKAHEEPEAGDVPILRMGDIRRGRVQSRRLKYVGADGEGVPDRMLVDGDLLFNRTNSFELVGKTAVYHGQPPDATFASYLIRVRTQSAVEADWCAVVINSPFGRAYIEEVVAQQVGQANVNGTKLKQFPMPLPPHREQARILAELERQMSFLDACERSVDAGLEVSAALRRSVLKAAFEGRLVPQDPTDEPASVLLERIRADRAANPRPRKRRARATA
jgi:type I restriction enzyme S subunit